MCLFYVFLFFHQVERVSCRDLSFADFFHKYAQGRRPVIITDMVETMTTVPWDLQHIREVAGRRMKESMPHVGWAVCAKSWKRLLSEFRGMQLD